LNYSQLELQKECDVQTGKSCTLASPGTFIFGKHLIEMRVHVALFPAKVSVELEG